MGDYMEACLMGYHPNSTSSCYGGCGRKIPEGESQTWRCPKCAERWEKYQERHGLKRDC